MSAAIVGRIGYHAGVDGTVTLAAGEKMIGMVCVATGAGGYVTIDGGDQIPLIAGIPFSQGTESRTEEWVGVAIVFHGTAGYFVKTKTQLT
jgi:hypothetical protein